MSLQAYGFDSFYQEHLEPYSRDGLDVGRVVLVERGLYRLYTEDGEVEGVLSGRLRHHAGDSDDLPAVGDWVVTLPRAADDEQALIQAVLPRRSKISRKVAGTRTREQLVAANVDVIFIVMGLDGDYNPRRLERFLVMAWESDARPVVVLNKADLADDVAARRAEIEEIALDVPVVAVSCLDGEGLDAVGSFVCAGETIALVGSSGVGKSTLINRLAGRELLRTAAVRSRDDRGQHTTTHRQLVPLPSGGLLIDNPGIREIQLWASGESFSNTFEDVEALAVECRFRDCTHQGEPGCAVEAALDDGRLAPERLASWRGLEKELQYLERRQDEQARRANDRRFGKLYRSVQAEKKKARQRF